MATRRRNRNQATTPHEEENSRSAPLENETSSNINALINVIRQQGEAQMALLREVQTTMSKIITDKLDEGMEACSDNGSIPEMSDFTSSPLAIDNLLASTNEQSMIHEDPLLSMLNQNSTDNSYGEDLLPAVAESMKCFNTLQISKENMESLKEKYKVPNNCRTIGIPKVNPEIWSALPTAAQHSDLTFQNMQGNLARSVISNGKLMELIIKNASSMPNDVAQSALRLSIDTFNSLALANKDLIVKRRATIKPHLNSEYSMLCSPQVPVSEMLFGENLEAQMRTMKSVSKVVKPLTPKRRFAPYTSTRGKRLNYQGRSRQSGASRYLPRGRKTYKKDKKEEKSNETQQ